jgi:hypothetical protein
MWLPPTAMLWGDLILLDDLDRDFVADFDLRNRPFNMFVGYTVNTYNILVRNTAVNLDERPEDADVAGARSE